MCQSSKDGGVRCAVHMHGSRAMSKLAAVTVNISKEDANNVLRDLRKEGKAMDLPAPTPEQVRAFAALQKRNVQNDPMITPREKNMINKNLDEAAREQPSGSVFHSWRNAVSEAMSRFMKKPATKVSAILLAGTMAMSSVAACGTSTDPGPTNTGTPPSTSAPTTPGETESPTTPTEQPTETTPPVVDNPITTTSGVVPGEAVNDGLGDYQQITLSEDSFLYSYDETLITDTATLENYSQEDVTAAQKVVMDFVVEEALDSTLACNATDANKQAWIDSNIDRFAPESRESFTQDIMAPGSGVVNKNTNAEGNVWRGDCIYDGGTRVKSIEVGPQSIYTSEGGQLVFHVKGTTQREVTAPGTRGQEGTPVYLENTEFDVKYSVSKSEDGSWLLVGSNTNFNSVTDTENPVS